MIDIFKKIKKRIANFTKELNLLREESNGNPRNKPIKLLKLRINRGVQEQIRYFQREDNKA